MNETPAILRSDEFRNARALVVAVFQSGLAADMAFRMQNHKDSTVSIFVFTLLAIIGFAGAVWLMAESKVISSWNALGSVLFGLLLPVCVNWAIPQQRLLVLGCLLGLSWAGLVVFVIAGRNWISLGPRVAWFSWGLVLAVNVFL